jgi:hypothetical protein
VGRLAFVVVVVVMAAVVDVVVVEVLGRKLLVWA